MPATPKVPEDHKKTSKPKTKKAAVKSPKATAAAIAEVRSAGWGHKNDGELIELPSGAVVRAMRPGVQGLVQAGILESLDALTGIVQSETIPKAEGKREIDVSSVLKDSSRLGEMMEMLDRVTLHVVTEPKIYPAPVVPEDAEEGANAEDFRQDNRAYIDLIDPDDKTFIMNFAFGGTRDLSTFREETETVMAGVHDGETDGDTSK